jgi:hypothetical protein
MNGSARDRGEGERHGGSYYPALRLGRLRGDHRGRDPPGGPAPGELTSAIAARGCDIEVITLEFGQTWTQPVRR